MISEVHSGSHIRRLSHSDSSDAAQMSSSSSMADPNIKALRDEEDARTMASSVSECMEVSWHRADIV